MSWPSENAPPIDFDAQLNQQQQLNFDFWPTPLTHHQQQLQEQQQSYVQPNMKELQLQAFFFLQQQQQEQYQQEKQTKEALAQPNGESSDLSSVATSTVSPMTFANMAGQPSSTTLEDHHVNQTSHVGDVLNASSSNRYTSTPLSTVDHLPSGDGFPSFALDLSMIQNHQYDSTLFAQLAGAQNFIATTMAADSGTSTLFNANTTTKLMNSADSNSNYEEKGQQALLNNNPSSTDRTMVLRGNPDQKFRSVDGRLSVLSDTRKHDVTVGEINRRVNGPESLNMSLIVSILRMAKNKHISEKMRKELAPYNIELTPGRRKNVPTTTFTALCEDEAKLLASDYFGLARASYKSQCMGDRMLKLMDMKAVTGLAAFRKTIDKLDKIIEDGDKKAYQTTRPVDDGSPMSKATAGVIRLSHLTHGFGNPAVSNTLKMLQDFLRCSVDCIKDEVQSGTCPFGNSLKLMDILKENDKITNDIMAGIKK